MAGKTIRMKRRTRPDRRLLNERALAVPHSGARVKRTPAAARSRNVGAPEAQNAGRYGAAAVGVAQGTACGAYSCW